MRILAIRGANLASLADPFEITLSEGPLADTGLFAITGDTGAGKSTILDALCLALYGTYPRASVSRQEDVLDPSGEAIAVSDPKNILRRGASEGFAQVDFVGADGIACRATWGTRRARNRAAGRLQGVERKLERVDGAGTIETGIQAVRTAVEARSGFSFDEFRRSVLLAQGEFDALLLADESQRAALMEKITGTEIYTRVSREVHETAARIGKALAALKDQRTGIGVCAPDIREGLEAELSMQRAALQTATASLKTMEERLQAVDAIALGEATVARARAELATAVAEWDSAEPDRWRLARWQAADRVRPEAERYAEREAAWKTARAALETAEAAVATSSQSHDAIVETVGQRGEEEHAATASVRAFEPQWEAAAICDQKILLAEKEEASARAGLDTANSEAAAAAHHLEDVKRQMSAGKQDLTSTQRALDSAAAQACLREPRLQQIFINRATLVQRLSDAAEALQIAEQTAREMKDAMARLDAAMAAQRLERERLIRDRDALRERRAALDGPVSQEQENLLTVLEGLARQAITLVKVRDEADHAGQTARKDFERATADQAKASGRLAPARALHETLQIQRAEVGKLSDLADATLSAHASHLRSLLTDNEPCPVCGAREHPYDNDASAAAVTRALRDRRDDIERQLTAAAAQMQECLAEIERAGAEARVARETVDRETVKFRAIAGDLGSVWRELLARWAEAGLGDAPAKDTLQALADGQQRLAAERARLAPLIAEVRTIARDLDMVEAQITALTSARESQQSEADEIRKMAAAANEECARARQSRQHLEDSLAALDRELQPYLAAAGLDLAGLERDAAHVRDTVLQLAESYTALETHVRHTGERLARLQEGHRTAEAAVRRSEDDRARAAHAHQARLMALNALKTERVGLLGGEHTAMHKSLRLQRQREAIDALRQAQADEARAREDASAAKIRRAEADKLCTDRAQQRDDAAQAYARALAEAGLMEAEFQSQSAVSAGDRDAVVSRLDALRQARDNAEAALRLREADLVHHRNAGDALSESERTALRQDIEDRSADTDRIREQLARLKAALDRDDEARLKAAELTRQIKMDEAVCAIWQDVNSAIGSADGAKFRRFAQGVTLEQLIVLANRQLLVLNRRYALTRGLSDLTLDVVDRDMGDEVRSPRSLSGGERFLVSLALALALSGLDGRQSFVDTLFIDEGFGTLDRETLDVAITALETLQGQGRKVGVITHVPAMIEQIPVQVRVEKRGGGRSVVRIIEQGAGFAGAA